MQARGCSLAQYEEEMAKWRNMAEAVRACAPSEVHCRLLLVHCAALQSELEAKANELAAGVAELVVAELRERSRQISDAYQAIFERLQEANGNAEEVMATQECADCNPTHPPPRPTAAPPAPPRPPRRPRPTAAARSSP